MPCTIQWSSKPSGVCLYVRLLTTLSKLYFPIFFYILLGVFNLQDLMQSSYRGKFIFGHKGTTIKIS